MAMRYQPRCQSMINEYMAPLPTCRRMGDLLCNTFGDEPGKRDIIQAGEHMYRETLAQVSRIVVKLGTGVLTDSQKQTDMGQMVQLVAQIASIRKSGHEVVLVSSGAVGAGMGALGYDKRPTELDELQACRTPRRCENNTACAAARAAAWPAPARPRCPRGRRA